MAFQGAKNDLLGLQYGTDALLTLLRGRKNLVENFQVRKTGLSAERENRRDCGVRRLLVCHQGPLRRLFLPLDMEQRRPGAVYHRRKLGD
jgi:hypothetical protein